MRYNSDDIAQCRTANPTKRLCLCLAAALTQEALGYRGLGFWVFRVKQEHQQLHSHRRLVFPELDEPQLAQHAFAAAPTSCRILRLLVWAAAAAAVYCLLQ